MNGQDKTDKERGTETQGAEGMAEMMASCCEGAGDGGPEGMAGMMATCCQGMRGCRWFPLFPAIAGVILFLLGYFLDANVVRILWLVISGAIVPMAFVGVMVVSMMFRR